MLARPAGFAGDLGEKEAGLAAEGEVNSLLSGFEVEDGFCFLKGAEEGDFDGKFGQFESCDGLGEKAGIADDGFGGGGEGEAEGLGGVEQADAAAEGVIFFAMQGNEASGGLGEEGIAEVGQRQRIATKAAGDDVGGKVEDSVLGLRGDFHCKEYPTVARRFFRFIRLSTDLCTGILLVPKAVARIGG